MKLLHALHAVLTVLLLIWAVWTFQVVRTHSTWLFHPDRTMY
jgi:hypothetical protein